MPGAHHAFLGSTVSRAVTVVCEPDKDAAIVASLDMPTNWHIMRRSTRGRR